jgi:ABC-type phosphate transport system auxiliary subunit
VPITGGIQFAGGNLPGYAALVSVEQIEKEVAQLERDQFARFSAWFERFRADAWDKQISRDAEDGKFDAVFAEIDEELQRGEIRPL